MWCTIMSWNVMQINWASTFKGKVTVRFYMITI